MRRLLLALPLLLGQVPVATAQVSVGIGIAVPGVQIGIQLPIYPEFERIPGYPVYYAPRVSANFFFYDGLYWVFHVDTWYASSWYNGPWTRVDPYAVPLFVLRIPVRYYRLPPPYFRGWRPDAPPRWGERWGREWQERHRGWDQWDRRSVPPPAPLPGYQLKYPQSRYPHEQERQRQIHAEEYRYRPRDPAARQADRSPDDGRARGHGPQGREGAPGRPGGDRKDDRKNDHDRRGGG